MMIFSFLVAVVAFNHAELATSFSETFTRKLSTGHRSRKGSGLSGHF